MLRSFYLLVLNFVTMLLMMLTVSLQLTFFQFVCRGAFLVCSVFGSREGPFMGQMLLRKKCLHQQRQHPKPLSVQ